MRTLARILLCRFSAGLGSLFASNSRAEAGSDNTAAPLCNGGLPSVKGRATDSGASQRLRASEARGASRLAHTEKNEGALVILHGKG
jgi:hypothetical protein